MSEFELPRVEKELFNVDNENLQKLASLFPSAVKDGQLDIDALKEELGQFEEVGQEKYELNWAGKQNAKKEARKNPVGRTLRYIKGDGVDEDTTQNLYIEGDNLEVLKLLRKNYYGSIKMIYIDPPYNTGNDFVYNDNFSMTQEELEQVQGERDEYGERLQKNSKDSARYHTNWLNMMYPRLQLAKDLLTEDGIIFLSIDDNEVDNLKKLCNEIFVPFNFVADLIWANKEGGGSSDSKLFRIKHEHILVYSKNIDSIEIYGIPVSNEDRYKSSDEYENTRGKYYLQKLGMGTIQYSESLDYPIKAPDGSTIYPKDNNNGKKACWRWSKSKYDWGMVNGFIEIKKDSNSIWTVYTKQYLNCDNEGNIITRTQRPMGIIDSFSSTQASKFLDSIGLSNVFPYSKPQDLICYLMKRINTNNSIVLDFFSGSGTTAHSVMQLNSEDNKNRKFILVQLPEITDEGSAAKKAGFDNICEIGKERIKRVGQKIKEKIEQGNTQLRLGEEPKKDPDIGFKVFRVGETTLNWEKMALKGEDILHDYAPDTSNKDKLDFTPTFENDFNVVYEIMLRQEGLPLTSRIETLTDIGNRTYLVANTYLISLEENITPEIVEKLSLLNPIPMKFIFRDSAFEDNIDFKDETFRRLNALIDKNSYEDKKTYTVEFI